MNMSTGILQPIHMAFAVHDLAAARQFHGEILGCSDGRSARRWVDFDLYGHQIVAHLTEPGRPLRGSNPVGGDELPVPHLGVVPDIGQREALSERLRRAGARFLIEPHLRFRGKVREQATLFVLDPSGNALELRAFAGPRRLFAR